MAGNSLILRKPGRRDRQRKEFRRLMMTKAEARIEAFLRRSVTGRDNLKKLIRLIFLGRLVL